MQTIRIPQERIPVLLGSKGTIKRKIEKLTKSTINVGDIEVEIEGDPIYELTAKDIVHAIGRGFTPEKALTLLDEDQMLVILHLTDFATTSNSMHRLKARIIGEEGKTRKKIERTTNTLLSIYGKTIGIIGSYDDVHEASEAVVMLLSGSKHATVYKRLDRNKRQ